MKKIRKSLIYILFLLLAGCSHKIKPKDIQGQWETNNDLKNKSKIIFYIADSTILTEFYFHDGIKKVQFKYKIRENKDNLFIITTINPFGKMEKDTIVYLDSLIMISTEESKNLYLKKYK
jgi:hypothetical protein